MFDKEVLLQAQVGIVVVPRLEGWYFPAFLFVKVSILGEQITRLDPVFDLV